MGTLSVSDMWSSGVIFCTMRPLVQASYASILLCTSILDTWQCFCGFVPLDPHDLIRRLPADRPARLQGGCDGTQPISRSAGDPGWRLGTKQCPSLPDVRYCRPCCSSPRQLLLQSGATWLRMSMQPRQPRIYIAWFARTRGGSCACLPRNGRKSHGLH